MGKIERFEDLDIWKKAMEIGVELYKVCETTKIKNDYGLKDQFRNTLLSISNNISEGFEYGNNKDFIRFLRFAKGSAGEVRNILHFTYRIEYINKETFEKFQNELLHLSRQIANFIKCLNEHEKKKK